MVSTRSPMRSASRAAQASARLGLSRVVRSRWRGRSGSISTGRSGSSRVHSAGDRAGEQDEDEAERQVEAGVEVDHDAAGSASSSCSQGSDQLDQRHRDARQPSSLNSRLPTATRRAAGSSARVAVTAGMAPPRLAPSTSAQALASGSTPTLGERHDQQHDRQAGMGEPGRAARRPAPGSAPRGRARRTARSRIAASRIGAEAARIRRSASSIRPRPIATRPSPW